MVERSVAQKAAARNWARTHPAEFQAWLAKQPRRPRPPSVRDTQLYWIQQCDHRCGRKILIRGQWGSHGASPGWQEVVDWINDPDNMTAPSGSISKFYCKRMTKRAHFAFSQPDIALAFKMRFG